MDIPAERRARYETILSVLVGLPLTFLRELRRPLCLELEFGPQEPFTNHRGEEMTRAENTLHLSAGWRIWRDGTVILGSDDHGKRDARRFYDRKTPPREACDRLRWRRAKALFAEVEAGTRTVVEVGVSEAYEPWFRLDDGTLVSTLMTSSYPTDDFWFFRSGERTMLVWPEGGTPFPTKAEDEARNPTDEETRAAIDSVVDAFHYG